MQLLQDTTTAPERLSLLEDATAAPEFFGFCQRLTTNFSMHRSVTLARKESALRRETKIVRRQNRKKLKKNKHMTINSHNNDGGNQPGSLRVCSETVR
jgi:hypothetical protein